MRTNESLPVFRHSGTAYEPPEAGSTARAKRVIRAAYCKFTGQTRTVTRAVHHNHNKSDNTESIRTSVIDRKPQRPISTGFHTKEEKRIEADERDVHWRGLTFNDQIAALDRRLGVGRGATKQRTRLTSQVEIANHTSKMVANVAVNQKQSSTEKTAKAAAHSKALTAARYTKK